MNIDRPIFIIGSGRSGTTILYELLSTHPDVCWFANYNEYFPVLQHFPILHRLLDLPVLGPHLKRCIIDPKRSRLRIRPEEGDRIYHRYCGFEENRKTTEADRTPELEGKFKGIIDRYLAVTGKKRFLSKQISNNQRLRLIDALFPDARYIHIIRDGRAVASSLYHVEWWKDITIWWYGRGAEDWEREGKDPIELCAVHWMRDVQEILENRPQMGDRYFELRYEELTQDVHGVLQRIVDFAGLDAAPAFFDLLPATLPNMDYKWEKLLTEAQKAIVNATVSGFMEELAARKGR